MNTLINIIDTFNFLADEPLFCSDEDAAVFIETVMNLMDNYIKDNLDTLFDDEEDFEVNVYEDVKEIVEAQFEHHTFMDEDAEFDLDEMYDEAFEIYMDTFIRDAPDLTLLKEEYRILAARVEPRDLHKERIQYAIDKIRAKPQPPQRTTEWYEFRHNLITASNAWKALDSQAQQNSLIYEKCQPMRTFETDPHASSVNINSSLHWGQKYEPLSVLIYEKLNETTVEDFGCIKHDDYSFLGASPDGIITDESSPKFGRMLEIKNVVSREITGVPKKEYWVQTQLQMEVCDLDDCDFLETKFVEYENMDDFLADKTEKQKGIIMYFQTSEGKPHYIYKLVDDFNKDKIRAWEEEMIETHQSPDGKSWVHNYYWKLEVYSCVLIQRDRLWFKNNIEQIRNIWSIIEQERVTGYEHRAPKKRVPKDAQPASFVTTKPDVKKPTFLLNIVKLQSMKN